MEDKAVGERGVCVCRVCACVREMKMIRGKDREVVGDPMMKGLVCLTTLLDFSL